MRPLRHLSWRSNYFSLLKSINRKQTFLCLGSRVILQPRTRISLFLLLLSLEACWHGAEAVALLILWDHTRMQPSSLSRLSRVFHVFAATHPTIFQCRSLWRWYPRSPLPRPVQWSGPGWWEPTGHPQLPEPCPCRGTAGIEPGPQNTAADGPCGGPGSGWGHQTEGRHT